MTSKEKSKFRGTSKWKKFRSWIKKDRKLDEITKSPLYAHFQVHHLDPFHYQDLSSEKFATLNSKSHSFIEWLYLYYRKDHTVIFRIVDLLAKMEDYERDYYAKCRGGDSFHVSKEE